MGSCDGAKICELVGLYLLNRLSTAIDKSGIGLYRDDGLAAINNGNSPKLDRIRKAIVHYTADFLDVTFNLASGKYFPFQKANNIPLHPKASSQHPPTMIKQLPKMINKIISN